jgi:endonuclease-8
VPEGDTVYKVARVLRRDLVGKTLEGLFLRNRGEVAPLVGAEIRGLETRGKHLLISFASEPSYTLHIHLGMKGRWDRYRAGKPWERPAYQAGARIDTAGFVHVCFRPMLAELLTGAELFSDPRLSRLGPDLLAENLDLRDVVRRARSRAPHTVSDLLLDQSVASGLGNEYRNELLFLFELHPETPLRALGDAEIEALFSEGRSLMRANLGGWQRTTTRRVNAREPLRRGEERTFVQGRAGKPCPRCGTAIRAGRTGDGARATYWCPNCQPMRAGGAAAKETGRPLSRTPGHRTEPVA